MSNDHGLLNNQGIEGITYTPHTQVWHATHCYTDGGGETRLLAMQRSFISFSWGGRLIEDFGLIVVTTNNAIERDISATFNNLTTELDVMDGQLFWGSHYNANSLDLTLHTDEISERQLYIFANWFKPGIERELILAEHPNRGIMARLAEPPHYSMLPFEKKIEILDGKQTSTTVYRGSMTIKFVMDDPFWYSINNFMEEMRFAHGWGRTTTIWATPYIEETWYDNVTHSGDAVKPASIEVNKDALKVIDEDGVPYKKMVEEQKINFGSKYTIYLSGEGQVHSTEDYSVGAVIGGNPYIGTSSAVDTLYGVSKEDDNLVKELYYYYGGNAPELPQLSFRMNPSWDGQQLYIDEPANIYRPFSSGTTVEPYTTIKLTSPTGEETDFKFTTPSILTAYNAAVKIFMDDISEGRITDMANLRQAVLENVHHPLIRDAIFAELLDETDIRGFVPRGILYALRRRFAYKPSTGVACNMIHQLQTWLNDNSYSSGATIKCLQRDVKRLVLPNVCKLSGDWPSVLTGENMPIVNGQVQSLQAMVLDILAVGDNSGSNSNLLIYGSGSGLVENVRALLSGAVSGVVEEVNNYENIAVIECNGHTRFNSGEEYKYHDASTAAGIDKNGILPNFDFTVDSKTGEIYMDYDFTTNIGQYSYNWVLSENSGWIANSEEWSQSGATSDKFFSGRVIHYHEPAGDMVRSDYLKLTETCYPAGNDPFNPTNGGSKGYINSGCCYKLTHNLKEGKLSNLQFLYRYRYY